MWTARFFSASINNSTECDFVNTCAQHRIQKTSGQKRSKKEIVEKGTIFFYMLLSYLFVISTRYWYCHSSNAWTAEL